MSNRLHLRFHARLIKPDGIVSLRNFQILQVH
jgi:hypothetical protein